MIQKNLYALSIALGLVAISALPARANFLTGGGSTATADCRGYALTVKAEDLTIGTAYTINYSFTLTCGAASPVTIPGSINFTATAATATVTATGTFGGNVSGNCTVTGTAQLAVIPLSTQAIFINGSNDTIGVPLYCQILSNCAAINATQGVPIIPVTLTATGGAGPPYTFTATGLPTGLSLSPGGTISGTPTVGGTFPYTVTIHDSAGNTGMLNCSVTVTAICTIPPSGTAIGGSPVSWNKFNTVGSTDVAWIHAHIGTPKGVSATTTTTVQFTGVTFVLNGQTYQLPDGFLIFNPSALATPTTTFDSTFAPNGRWVTTLNPNALCDEIFFDGNAIPVDSNISGGGKATFNYTTLSSDNNLAFSWQWSAAVFTYWPGNNQAQILPCHQSDHAGTPENRQVQQSLIQGPRGGGGSNYTGSWSGTGNGACPGAH